MAQVAKRSKTIREAETAPEFREAVVVRWRQIIQRHFTKGPLTQPTKSEIPPPPSRRSNVHDRFSDSFGKFGRGNERPEKDDEDADDDEG